MWLCYCISTVHNRLAFSVTYRPLYLVIFLLFLFFYAVDLLNAQISSRGPAQADALQSDVLVPSFGEGISPAHNYSSKDEPNLSDRAIPIRDADEDPENPGGALYRLIRPYYDNIFADRRPLYQPTFDPTTFRPVQVAEPPLGLYPRGRKPGLVEVYLWAGVAQSYDSNVQLTATNPIADFFFTPRGGIEVSVGTPDTILGFQIAYEAYEDMFYENPNLDAFNQKLDLAIRVGRDDFIWRPYLAASDLTGSNLLLREAAKKMGKVQEVVGYFGEESVLHQKEKYVRLGSVGALEGSLSNYKMSRLLIDQTCLDHETLNRIAKECILNGVIVSMIPDSIGFWVGRSHDRMVSGMSVLVVANSSYYRRSRRFIKRATDIVGAMVGIVISAPIILVLALLIRLESKGPVWIRQKRAGLEGKSFWIYKLRSMRAGVEEDPHSWAANDDPRCTRLGKWIRKLSLDELPQFWCVLKGDMSLVGPRPEMAELVADFCDSVHSYGLRFRMKPGMTGWAAIHGFRGNTSLQERIDYDMYYIQNWSWSQDIKILVVTLFRLKSNI